MPKKFLTLTAFAESHGVTRTTVHRWSNRGHIVFAANGLVDVTASDALLADRPQVYRGGRVGGNPARGGVKDMKIAASTAIKETYLALLAKLRYEQSASKLCEIDAVLPVIEADYAAVRTRCLRIGGDVAAILAARETWPCAEDAKNIIDGEIIKVLAELTDDSAFEGDRPH